MKAYVIKNKEGKYLEYSDVNSDDIYFTTDLTLAMLYDENAIKIMKMVHRDFDFVEITIAEGDLEKQIRADERRKVCGEIREELQLDIDDKHGVVHVKGIASALDKIEKGESK